jgi:two-component sensor histidine kinase
MHHGMKNTLQVIASLVSLQEREAGSPDARRAHAAPGAQIHNAGLAA